MNERIKELAEESYNEFYNIHIDLELFAELIIKKCRDIVSDTKDQAIEEEWNVDEAMSTAMYDIEEYFAVKDKSTYTDIISDGGMDPRS